MTSAACCGRRSAGWTLIETMVAMGLGLIVMIVVSHTLISTSRATRAQNQRAMRQAGLQAVVRHVETTLMQSMVAGIGWQTSAAGAVLTAHSVQTGYITTHPPKMETVWRLFLWDQSARKLYMGQSTAGGPPSDSKPQAMPAPEMASLLSAELPPVYTLFQGRPVADRVTNFAYSLEEGPLYRIDVEIDVPADDNPEPGDALERLQASVLIHPRNRI